ncbi:hypothetical protein Cob_v005814 [Colletotrichum orbiculare MAFF 240422]|uniref:Uncharacterized protein n=1 Tax=Colletotrichum orbiculare (strain 104-T / ATCC 96160 / CBS 514.97 / LARS 414 / MAFF 240422) TaxID=1213857 RepID=A0A484FTY5_COLOR|nr:hypothetical protein Cob_v005814 [Colletotrichum orbiculare MAFF 240422]
MEYSTTPVPSKLWMRYPVVGQLKAAPRVLEATDRLMDELEVVLVLEIELELELDVIVLEELLLVRLDEDDDVDDGKVEELDEVMVEELDEVMVEELEALVDVTRVDDVVLGTVDELEVVDTPTDDEETGVVVGVWTYTVPGAVPDGWTMETVVAPEGVAVPE